MIGGYSESKDALQTVEEINFKSDGSLIISPGPELNYARRNPMVVNYLNTMVVFGGSKDVAGKSVVKQVEQYTDTVTYVNNPPYFLTTEFPSLIEVFQEFTFQFKATDPDGDAIIFTLENGPTGSLISKAGLFKWTPTNEQANQNFNITVKISDGELSQTYTATTKTGPPIVIGVEGDMIPLATVLYQNYPNPFNPTTAITYSLRKDSHVIISVYDLLGREVMKLVDGYKIAGNYTVSLNGENLSSGVYIYKLVTDDYIGTKRMLLLK